MKDLIWMNGEIIPMSDARIGVEDRGFQFADGVYEVMRVYNGRAFTLHEHLLRLTQSATAIGLPVPLDSGVMGQEIDKLIARSELREGMIYLQLTRGAAPRNHAYPVNATSTLLFYPRPLPPVAEPGSGPGAVLWPVKDERWHRCWIKSIALLPNVMAKNYALAQGADEAVFVDGNTVSECSASNLFAVLKGRLVTHPVGERVLPGITRAVLLSCCAEAGVAAEERPLSVDECLNADELFITSTTREVSWVTRWEQHTIGSGHCGATTRKLHEALLARVRHETAAAC